MPLSPADFYAYSRATGTPFPEDPEERAQIAPEVLAFRRNQLKAPQQEEQQGFNLTNALGIGAALAGLGAGAYGLRRALGSRPPRTEPIPQAPTGPGTEVGAVQNLVRDLGPATTAEPEVREAAANIAAEPTPPPSQKPPTKSDTSFAKQYLQDTGAVAPEDLTGIQETQHDFVVQQQVEAVDSGLEQEEQRIDVKFQRHTGTDVPDVDIPQSEDTIQAFGLLPAAQRTLTREEREAKIFARLETEALKLGKTTHSATSPFGPEGRRIPPGPLLYPSQIPVSDGEQVLGVSSPTREFLNVFAQGDPRVQDVVRRENVAGFERVKTYGGVKGASLLEEDVFDPLSGELISKGEQITAAGKTRQVLNPAWTDAYQTYWERRAAELPHTLDDYQQRKAAGQLNYQLPAEKQSARNNAQMFEKWDSKTSEALQDLYAETVGDIPQYITEIIEPKTAFTGTQTQYRGQVGTTGETTGAPVPVLNPKGIVFGAQTKGQPFISVGERTLARAAQDPSYASGNVLRFKGEGSSTKLDVMPLSYDAEADVLLPSSVQGQQVRGKVKVTRTALVPLQKAVLVKDKQTGQHKTQLVNFSIDLTAPVGTRTAVDESGREVAKTVTLQEAVNDLRNYHGKDYASLNRDVDALLRSTHNAYDVPVMTRTSFDKYDEGRNEFIRMLSGSQYEAKEYGFLTSVEGQKLPYTGPLAPGSKGNRAENITNARLMLSQAGVPLDKISDYVPHAEELKPTPRVQATTTRDVGIPRPDIMSTGTELGVRTSTYERISPRMGGAVTSQLRSLIAKGAKIKNINGNVVYSTALGKVSYPENQLIDTLKAENQDAPSIAALVGRSIATEKTDPLAIRKEPSVLAQERGSEAGYYYNEAGNRIKEPITTPWGSFTGAARFAAGPASVASMGTYPQGGGRLRVKTSPTDLSQLQERNEFAYTANLTPGGTVRKGALQLGGGLGVISTGIESLPSESATIERYGRTSAQLKQFGDVLMARAAYNRGQQPGPTTLNVPTALNRIPAATPEPPVYGPSLPPIQGPRMGLRTREQGMELATNTEMAKYARRPSIIPEAVDPVQARNDAVARHIGNYISAASERMEGPASIQGVKLKGVGQNALRPYQAPSEGMIQQLMRAARRR